MDRESDVPSVRCIYERKDWGARKDYAKVSFVPCGMGFRQERFLDYQSSAFDSIGLSPHLKRSSGSSLKRARDELKT